VKGKKMADYVRVIDIGGDGFRRVDIDSRAVEKIEEKDVKQIRAEIKEKIKDSDILKRKKESISDLDSLMQFVVDGLDGGKIKGIAYSVAGVIEDHRLIKNSPNAHFLDDVDLKEKTEGYLKKTGLESFVFNDMETAVTGMATLLGKPPYFMGITWSTGIGLRIWSDGKILSVAEGGHMVLEPSPFAPLCGCGKRGHAEAIIGGASIERRVVAEANALGLPEELNITFGKAEGQIRAPIFLNEAYLGQYSGQAKIWSRDFYGRIVRGMGIFLANIQSLLNLPLIVWKGTVAREVLWSRLKLEPEVRAVMREYLIDPTWADQDNLRLVETPGPGDRDAFTGAAEAFKAISRG
jgi:predicted NBD/HSP70 family sugar kinase